MPKYLEIKKYLMSTVIDGFIIISVHMLGVLRDFRRIQ